MDNPLPNFEYVLSECARILGTTVMQMREHNKTRHISDHRAMTAWVLRELGMSLIGIGRMLDHNHTGILSMCRKVEASPALLTEASHLVEAFRRREDALPK